MTGNAGKTSVVVVLFFFCCGGNNLKIEKILNNNTAVTISENGCEMIVMGRGIAFNHKIGDLLDVNKIDKTFTLSDRDLSSKFQKLLSDIPMEHMLLSERIINYAKMKLGKKLNDSIYITLPDHISGAIQRYQEGFELKNPLLWDVKRFYQEEFEVGQKSIKVVEEETGVRLLEDEAAFIALHFVNAEQNGEIKETFDMTRIMQEITDIVRRFFVIEFDENSLNYYRFITHLKFFAQRILHDEHYDDDNEELLEAIKVKHNKAFQCVKKIKLFITEKYLYELSDEEMLYLTIHIARITKEF